MIQENWELKLNRHLRIEFGVSFSDLREGETRLVTTNRRDAKRFAGYFLPIWFTRRENKCIISVSSMLFSKVEKSFAGMSAEEVFSEKGLRKAVDIAETIHGSFHNDGACMFFLNPSMFKPYRGYEVVELKESDREVFEKHQDWFGSFNGYWCETKRNTRAFTIFESEKPVSTTFTMSNSIYAWEYAVWTRDEYRRKGYGKAVVSAAVEATFACDRLPIYSTRWENIASRRLAESLGFQLYCENYAIRTIALEDDLGNPSIAW